MSVQEERMPTEQLHLSKIAGLVEGLSAAAIQFALLYEENKDAWEPENRGCWEIFSQVSQITSRNARYLNKLLELTNPSQDRESVDPLTVQRLKSVLGKLILEICHMADQLPLLISLCRVEDLPKPERFRPVQSELVLENLKTVCEAELNYYSRNIKQELMAVKNLFGGESLPEVDKIYAHLENSEN